MTMLMAILLVFAGMQFRPTPIPGVPQVSDRRMAPDGVTEGWLVDLKPDPAQSGVKIATTLVVSRNGRELQRFHGEPGIANWDFWQSGREVVYQTAPTHGRTTCYLVDVQSGRILESQENCSNHVSDGPGWTTPLHT